MDNNPTINLKLLKSRRNLLAQADLVFETELFGTITMKKFCIWKSTVLNSRIKESISITPPSLIMYGKMIKLIFFEKQGLWEEIEQKIYDAYKHALKHENKSYTEVLSENVDFEELKTS